LLVRPTVNQRGGGLPNTIGIRYPTFVGKTDDSTQGSNTSPCLKLACNRPADRLAESVTPQKVSLSQVNSNPSLFDDA
jgi:hypothetical protein